MSSACFMPGLVRLPSKDDAACFSASPQHDAACFSAACTLAGGARGRCTGGRGGGTPGVLVVSQPLTLCKTASLSFPTLQWITLPLIAFRRELLASAHSVQGAGGIHRHRYTHQNTTHIMHAMGCYGVQKRGELSASDNAMDACTNHHDVSRDTWRVGQASISTSCCHILVMCATILFHYCLSASMAFPCTTVLQELMPAGAGAQASMRASLDLTRAQPALLTLPPAPLSDRTNRMDEAMVGLASHILLWSVTYGADTRVATCLSFQSEAVAHTCKWACRTSISIHQLANLVRACRGPRRTL